MITYLVGVPGSGKTAYAVYKILEYHDKKTPNGDYLYSRICNNIAGFKHDLLERSEKWKEDEFLEFVSELHKLYEQFKKLDDLDDILIEHCKKNNYFKSLIVVDECHNTFSTKYLNAWIWLLSYHRHIYLDFLFITQSMAMIEDSKLKNMAEIYIKAQPAGKRIFNSTFRYHHYESSRMFNNGKYKTESIKMTSDIFNYYQSGDNVKNKSIVRKYLWIMIVVVIAALTLLFYAYDSVIVAPVSHTKNVTISKNQSTQKISDPGASVAPGEKVLSVDFEEDSYLDSYSCMNGSCTFTDFYKVPEDLVDFLVNNSLISVIKEEKYTFRSISYVLITASAASQLSKYKNVIYDDKDKSNNKDNNKEMTNVELF